MVVTICKNTFISVAVGDADTDSSFSKDTGRVRSRSVEIPRSKPFVEQAQGLSEQSLARINSVLSAGFAPQSPPKKSVDSSYLRDQGEDEYEPDTAMCISELITLKDRLAKALGSTDQALEKPARAASSYSLSTMVATESSKSSLLWNSSNRSWSTASFEEAELESRDSLDRQSNEWIGFQRNVSEEATQQAKAVPTSFAGVTENAHNLKLCLSTDGSPLSHFQVPKHKDLQEMYRNTARDTPPTTMMIRNIPGRYTQLDFVEDLKELGFTGTFDFVYLPTDKSSSSNVGYAFVNFIESEWADKCKKELDGYSFTKHQRGSQKKKAKVSVAHLQGLKKNLQYYENTVINHREKRRRPMVFANIANVIGQ